MGSIVNLGKEEQGVGIYTLDKYPNILRVCISSVQSTLTEVLNISGSGFIDCAFITSHSTSLTANIQITIDGVVVIDSSVTTQSYPCIGFINSQIVDRASVSSNGTESIFLGNLLRALASSTTSPEFGLAYSQMSTPYNNISLPAVISANGPIMHNGTLPFKNSLVIKTIKPAGNLYIQGGYK